MKRMLFVAVLSIAASTALGQQRSVFIEPVGGEAVVSALHELLDRLAITSDSRAKATVRKQISDEATNVWLAHESPAATELSSTSGSPSASRPAVDWSDISRSTADRMLSAIPLQQKLDDRGPYWSALLVLLVATEQRRDLLGPTKLDELVVKFGHTSFDLELQHVDDEKIFFSLLNTGVRFAGNGHCATARAVFWHLEKWLLRSQAGSRSAGGLTGEPAAQRAKAMARCVRQSAPSVAGPGDRLMALGARVSELGSGMDVLLLAREYRAALGEGIRDAITQGPNALPELLLNTRDSTDRVVGALVKLGDAKAAAALLDLQVLLLGVAVDAHAAALRWQNEPAVQAYRRYRSLLSAAVMDGSGRLQSFASTAVGRDSAPLNVPEGGDRMRVMPVSLRPAYASKVFVSHLARTFEPFGHERIQQSLREGERGIVFGLFRPTLANGRLAEQKLYFVVRFARSSVSPVMLLGTEAQMENTVARVSADFRDGKSFQFVTAGTQLATLFADAAKDAAGDNVTLLVFAQGPVVGLPLDAMYRASRVSLGSAEIRTTMETSFRRMLTRREAKSELPSEITVFAGPPAGSLQLGDCLTVFAPALPNARREAEAVGASMGQRVATYVGDDASEATVKRLSLRGIVHFATHCTTVREDCLALGLKRLPQDARNPEDRAGWRAFLHFAETALDGRKPVDSSFRGSRFVEDGLLTSEEILGMDLTQTRLVFAAACHSGIGVSGIGGSDYSLRSAFAAAGSRTQIVSLWEIRDDLASQFVAGFYRELAASGSVSRSFYKARREMELRAAALQDALERRAILSLVASMTISGELE